MIDQKLIEALKAKRDAKTQAVSAIKQDITAIQATPSAKSIIALEQRVKDLEVIVLKLTESL